MPDSLPIPTEVAARGLIAAPSAITLPSDGWRVAVRVSAAVLAIVLVVTPGIATANHTVTHTRCTALTNEINRYRSDLRLNYLLCKVGRERADYILRTGDRRHSFTLLRRALAENGVCWTNSGEVLTTTNYDPSAAHFVRNWRGSSSHWNILMASRYERGGGTWRAAGGRYQAVYYVLDTC